MMVGRTNKMDWKEKREKVDRTQQVDSNGRAPDSHSGSIRFESRSEYRLS
jgi:hypothetical protein